MSQVIPATMKAVITQANKTVKIEDVPVPTIDDDEVLVQTLAVAQNPTDWKHIWYINNPGTINGCDFAGRVVKVGKNVQTVAAGDIVASFVHGGTYSDRGAFAEYVKASAELTWKVPDNITVEQATTLNCASWTVAQAFFGAGRLGLVMPPAKVNGEQWLYIHGGSSSVGMFAIQIAKISGYKVVTVASPRNHELCKTLGADAVFDYNSPDSIGNIKKITEDSIQYGLETISTKESQSFAVQVFGAKGGKLLTLLDPDEEAQQLRPDVVVQPTLVYTSLGREFLFLGNKFPASSEDRNDMVRWVAKQTEFVKQGLLKPNPVKILEGGIENIPAGHKYLMGGRNSAEKIVHRISD